MKRFLDKAMLLVGLLLLVYGYVLWLARHESPQPRAILSFVYLLPGWALATMGYIGWRTEERESAKKDSRDPGST
jgi:hypothetical protein